MCVFSLIFFVCLRDVFWEKIFVQYEVEGVYDVLWIVFIILL